MRQTKLATRRLQSARYALSYGICERAPIRWAMSERGEMSDLLKTGVEERLRKVFDLCANLAVVLEDLQQQRVMTSQFLFGVEQQLSVTRNRQLHLGHVDWLLDHLVDQRVEIHQQLFGFWMTNQRRNLQSCSQSQHTFRYSIKLMPRKGSNAVSVWIFIHGDVPHIYASSLSPWNHWYPPKCLHWHWDCFCVFYTHQFFSFFKFSVMISSCT